VRQVDAEGGFTENIYNAFGELIARVRSTREGQTTTSQFDYDLLGRVVLQTDDVGCINANTRTDYDALGRVSRLTDALGRQTVHSYDEATRSVTVTTEFSFDTTGRPTGTLYNGYYDVVTGSVERDPGADRFKPEASIVYDTLGNAVRIGSRMGFNAFQHTWRTYDSQGRVVHEINALNNVTRYTYNSFGEQETVTRYSVTISGTQQNGVYWIPSEIDPQLNFGVDETGHVIEDSLARTIQLTYDKLGRKSAVTLPTATFYSTQMPGDTSQVNHFRPSPQFVTGVQDAAVTRYEYNAFSDVVLQLVRYRII
jgi:large repetitive protein